MTDYQVSSYFMSYELPNIKPHYYWGKEEIPLIQVQEGLTSHVLTPISKARQTAAAHLAHVDCLFLWQ